MKLKKKILIKKLEKKIAIKKMSIKFDKKNPTRINFEKNNLKKYN